MKALIDLLESKNIRSALIVDDAFDAVPLATDMSVLDRDEWSQFFSDLTVEDRERLALEYPVFNSKSGDDLMEDSAFVACLWRIRDELSPGTAKMLFDRYSADNGGAVQQLAQAFAVHRVIQRLTHPDILERRIVHAVQRIRICVRIGPKADVQPGLF